MVRVSNEDAYVASDRHKTFLIADGMGGHAAGEIASQLAAETVKSLLEQRSPDSRPDGFLQHAIQEANALIYETQMQKPECRGMGSTLTVLSFSDSMFHIAHVGDSRAYLLRGGTLDQLTQDHSVVWPLYENGILTKEDIAHHPQKNLITRSVGTYPQVEADSLSNAAHAGDIFLLCSDGLTDVLTDQEIARTLSVPARPVQDLADQLVDAANAAGGPDNITVVVVRLVSEE
jgi:serine/threonine protein phosphatase PrpC